MASVQNSTDPGPIRQSMASVQNSTDLGPTHHSMASAHNSSNPAPTCQHKASVQISFDPAPECQTMVLEHGSLSPGRNCQENVSHGDKTADDAPNQRQQPTTPLNNHTTPAPTCQNPPITSVISSENITQAKPHAENDEVADDEFI
nr:hypothetical protein [Tanacetum cinerariifolium]